MQAALPVCCPSGVAGALPVPDALLVALAVLHVGTRLLLTVVAAGIAVSSLDDIFVDAVYFARNVWRHGVVYRRHAKLHADDLISDDPGWMAIIVPAWDEAAVIAAMLRDCTRRLDYPRYRIFVGSYPNDPATLAAAASVGDGRIQQVVCTRPGPTTKADCLNHLWRAVQAHEAMMGWRFKAIVLHDAEDVVHARELHVYDHLIPKLAMVQLPVAPLVDGGSRWISGHYLDEFAEAHAKDIVVREALGAAVPSAGVACAIDRNMLEHLAGPHGHPFDPACMTEDYELGIRIKAAGGRGALVRIRGDAGETVATREHFPATLDAALRQKTRWLLGISLNGWDRVGWPGNWADRYMLLRDRKAILTALLTAAGYSASVLVLLDLALARLSPKLEAFGPLVAAGSGLATLLWFNAAMLGWRIGLRAGFTTLAHGWREGLRSIPRVVIGNLINAAAAWRAMQRYRAILRGSIQPAWDKTAHRFPSG